MSDVALLKQELDRANARIAELEAMLPPPPAPVNVDVPLVMGIGSVGQTLTCTMGNWQNTPTSYAYAWQTDGAPNSAADAATYTVMASDVGLAISCIVTATNAGGSTQAPMSNEIVVEDVVQAEAARRRQEGKRDAA